MPGDGAYFVALVPRDAGEASPDFVTLGDGKVLKVSGAFGTDYAFLSDIAETATAEGAVFSGTVANVQDRTSGLVLALGAEGSVTCKNYGIASAIPASLRIDANVLTVTLTSQRAESHVTVTAPEGWTLDPSVKEATGVSSKKTEHRLSIAAGVTEARLLKMK